MKKKFKFRKDRWYIYCPKCRPIVETLFPGEWIESDEGTRCDMDGCKNIGVFEFDAKEKA